MSRSILSIATVLAVLVCTCRPAARHGRTTPADAAAALADPWISQYRGDFADFQRVEPSRVAVVIEAQQEEAQDLLQEKPWVELSPELAARYSPDLGAGAPAEGRVVLLRCVQTYRPAKGEGAMDELWVGWNAGKVRVVFKSVRESYVPVRHVAIVADLPSSPAELFVDALTAIW
jgi:hypothetical protein